MADLYPSMTALEAARVKGVDYDIYTIDTNHDVLVSSIHGGGIEIGTSELNYAVRELGGYDSFIFEALLSSGNSDLHVTSTNYDEPTLVRMVINKKQNIALHGASGDTPIVYVGGLDFCLRNTIMEELIKKGFNAQIAPPEIIGEQPDNVSNRTNSYGCVQLEMTTQFRKDFFLNGDWSRSKRSDRKNWTSNIYNVAQAIVTGVEKAKNTYMRDRYTSYLMDFYNNININGEDNQLLMNSGTRRVHFRMSVTNGVPTLTYRRGEEFIQSVTSDANGISITFKNVPNGTIPFYTIEYVSSQGLQIDATKSIGYDYARTANNTSMIIGLKESPSGSVAHTPLSAIINGVAEIKIDL